MSQTNAYATHGAKDALVPFTYPLRAVGPSDVRIRVAFCGICHSDIHQARNEWGGAKYPMVPGHEIAGVVSEVGKDVKRYKVGARVGVGCFVDSCRRCENCTDGFEQFCDSGCTQTYNGVHRADKSPTYGGYSSEMVVDEHYVLRIDDALPLDAAAPLLCAGITTYSPLKHWQCGPKKRVAVVGLGGLGHVGVKIAAAMGAEVTVISHSDKKRADAARLGAKHFINTQEKDALTNAKKRFDIILNTVSEGTDWNALLGSLRRDGAMVMVGLPSTPVPVHAGSLISQRRRLTGSNIGGIAETQEMLDFCAQHGITCDIETIEPKQINDAFERVVRSDVRYRFVINAQQLAPA